MDLPNPAAAVQVPAAPAQPKLRTVRGQPYQPAIGPRLKVLLFVIFVSVAVLGATGVYLTAIRLLEAARGLTYTNQFTLGMFLAHVVWGVLLVIPFLFFGFTHLASARRRPNRVAVRLGIALFVTGIIVGLTGLALIQLEKLPQLPTGSVARWIVYGLHLAAPALAVVFYVLHRRAGPAIHWNWGYAWAGGVGLFVAFMCVMHSFDPRQIGRIGPKDGEKYFYPSLARTATGKFIPAEALMLDDYCKKCHADIYNDWFHSAHHFSSFNNPPYLFSVRETRSVGLKRDKHVRASRWCAGCHDVVPFFSGAFDDPDFDDVHHPTAQAGITCVSCHAITHINGPVGNAAYTIEEPLFYPFTYSKNAVLQWLNNQLVKARPEFHKQTMLKDLHRSPEFCSTCHKVNIPLELNHYREFLRGQNHYDTYLLSGQSGVGARSFYYPPQARTKCADCHMPLRPSGDFGSKDFDGSGVRKIHNHFFPGADTGLLSLLTQEPRWQKHAEEFRQAIQTEADFLRGTDPEGKDRSALIELFGLKEGGTIEGRLTAPLQPALPRLRPGGTYLVEVVVRTLNMGHPFPQGTADSNEIWVDFEARSAGRILGRNGALSGPGDSGKVDEWSHFINVLMLDRKGKRINRRNPQDIFTPLYDHQIPPGAAQVVHYKLHVPRDVKGPVELKVRLRYRKFDYEYMSLVYQEKGQVPPLPIVDMSQDAVTVPVEGVAAQVPVQEPPRKPLWQRWNDYGIGCFLEGGVGAKKGELRQAEEAFQKLLTLNDKAAQAQGHLNLARVYFDEGRLRQAADALNQAQATGEAPWWVVAWFTGLVNAQNGHLDEAIGNFKKILDPAYQPRHRKFDFTRDYVVRNELGATYFRRAQQEDEPAERDRFLRQAIEQYERTLTIDPEDLDAHYGLSRCFAVLGEAASQRTASVTPEQVDKEILTALAGQFTDEAAPREQRLQAAADLARAIAQFGGQPTTVDKPKLPTLLALIGQCRPIYERPGDEGLRSAAALVLEQLYWQTHAIYKPDENAKDRTIRMYRAAHPAAAAASQAIVIYPLNRAGAPGL